MGVEEEEEEQVWEEIERAESFLVSSMYEEASELACSIIKKRIEKMNKREKEEEGDEGEEEERDREVLECCGMVILQSIHNNLSSDILSCLSSSIQLKLIPPRLILTGACLEMSSSSPDGPSDVARTLEKYLEEVMDVGLAEFFLVEVLATALQDVPRAVSWLQRNTQHLPRNASQELLTRLQNLPKPVTPSVTKPSELSSSSLISDKHKQQPLLGLSKGVEPCFWWLRVLNPKLLLVCLALVLYWNLRRKQLTLKGAVKSQASKLKKAVIDVWQLAFSHPLAYA